MGFIIENTKTILSGIEKINSFLQMNTIRLQLKHTLKIILISPLKNCDIKSLKESDIKEWIGAEPVDLIIGGPPCQSFSTVGQRNYDEKAQLYTEYLEC